MQQTKQYALNLIERSDVFSPDPLNENMEKVEAALGTARSEAAAGDSALDARVTALEARRAVVGTYTGNGVSGQTGQFINLGFTPRAVLVQRSTYYAVLAVTEKPVGVANLVVVNNGFTVSDTGSISLNVSGQVYAYLAIL